MSEFSDDVSKLFGDYGNAVVQSLSNEAQTLLHVAVPATGLIKYGTETGGNFIIPDVYNSVKTTAQNAGTLLHDVVNIVNPGTKTK